MRKISRIFLFGVMTLVLLTACTGQEQGGSPTAQTTIPADQTAIFPPVGTGTPGSETALPEATLNTTATIDTATLPAGTDTTQAAATDTTQTAGIPVTGPESTLLECQYCIEGMAHALLILPDTATFETVTDTATLSTPGPDTGCHTVDTFNGRQVVICRAQENTSLNLNICTDGNNCTQLLVELQSCPVTNQPGVTATETPGAGVPTDTPVVGPTNTPGVGLATPTP